MAAGIALSVAQLGVAVADLVISPDAERVVNKALSYLGSSPLSSDNLKNLETDTQLVKGILRAAGARPAGDILEPWMKKLRTAYFEAEDILDVIDYHRIESRILSQKHESESTSTASRSNIGDDLKIPEESLTKLKEALDNIRNLISEGQQLLSLLDLQAGCDNKNNAQSSTFAAPITTTSIPPAFVFGRNGERDKIIGELRGPPAAGKCYTVIGIHGVAGSGKTTLAQHVLEKERKDEHFDAIMWIHVTQTFSVVNVLNEMLEIVSDGRDERLSNPDMLQSKLNEKLKGKRFFLVLDDVWYEKGDTEKKLHLLLGPLKDGKVGSRILVTSRTTDVAGALSAKSNLIEDLEEDEYLSMFLHYALHGATLTDEASTRRYHSIGKRIANKLGRSPLAATTVASQLKIRQNDIGYWIDVMKSDLWKDTVGALFWSYQQLEEHVKQCFRYCSIFPRRYELEQDELVHLWMAEGFVKTTGEKEDTEKVAKDYFHVLLSSSFIQPKRKTSENEYFTIHDLLHDLAEEVAGTDCFRIKKGMVDQIPKDVRHIFIESCDPGVFTEQILKLKALRTLIMTRPVRPVRDAIITENELKSLLSLQKLRVLHVTVRGLRELPECIGELKHLRYLRYLMIPVSPRINLPLGFTKLYHLQKFATHHCTDLQYSASEEMANLVNLRHTVCAELEFPNVGRMTWLRTLRVFTVKETKGYEIHQLECLDNISGTLFIEGLQNVKSKEEALQAKLDNKVHILNLILQWEENYGMMEGNLSDARTTSRVTQAEVIEALRPPFQVKSLRIKYYKEKKYPSWLEEEQGVLDNLQQLEISHCDAPPKTLAGCLYLHAFCITHCGWSVLPENIMEPLKSLKILYIESCKNLQSLPKLPESLDLLRISECPKLSGSYEKVGSIWEKIQKNMTIKISFDTNAYRNCQGVLELM